MCSAAGLDSQKCQVCMERLPPWVKGFFGERVRYTYRQVVEADGYLYESIGIEEMEQ